MQQKRTLLFRWMSPQACPGDDFTAPPDETVVYSGAPVKVHCGVCAAGAGRA